MIDANAPTQVAPVYSLCAHNGDLIVGGDFDGPAGGTLMVSNICGYDGANWFALGSGIQGGWVQCLLSWDSTLYVGGGFGDAGGADTTNSIAKWKNGWDNVGDDDFAIIGGQVYSMAVYDSVLYIGGNFTELNSIPMIHIARLLNYPDTFLVDTTAINEIENEELIIEIYPNPTENILTINSKLSIVSTIEIRDITGRLLQTQTNKEFKNEITLDVNELVSGIYLLKIKTKEGTEVVKKFVIE